MLSSYEIVTTEVRYTKWYKMRVWVEARGYVFANKGSEDDDAHGAVPCISDLPVMEISWRDAIAQCNDCTEMLMGDYYNVNYEFISKQTFADAYTRGGFWDIVRYGSDRYRIVC